MSSVGFSKTSSLFGAVIRYLMIIVVGELRSGMHWPLRFDTRLLTKVSFEVQKFAMALSHSGVEVVGLETARGLLTLLTSQDSAAYWSSAFITVLSEISLGCWTLKQAFTSSISKLRFVDWRLVRCGELWWAHRICQVGDHDVFHTKKNAM